ncbi:MAG: hypothetical protein NTX50_28620 [Candidatus Sumerlaeota bacterium]|nr:hypothetical protein [Candidatus Sumerlaeota bacterium]
MAIICEFSIKIQTQFDQISSRNASKKTKRFAKGMPLRVCRKYIFFFAIPICVLRPFRAKDYTGISCPGALPQAMLFDAFGVSGVWPSFAHFSVIQNRIMQNRMMQNRMMKNRMMKNRMMKKSMIKNRIIQFSFFRCS